MDISANGWHKCRAIGLTQLSTQLCDTFAVQFSSFWLQMCHSKVAYNAYHGTASTSVTDAVLFTSRGRGGLKASLGA